ncbi:L-threonine 3-dehydrogenase [Beijerinckiaceae bacterium RH AL1]|nr:L-threonine 3-dehydrogenase [Beijerinckiaceae bacterium RH AL1]
MANGNRVVTFLEPYKVKVETIKYPELADPHGKKIEHGVILRIVATNICGSDQHIYHGRFAAPSGMVMGHEMTGEVIEVGRDVEFIKKGDLCSVPFNVSCGRCRNCKERHTDVCMNVNDKVDCGAYGFNLGNWQGGQADYLMVPFADWNLLPFPDKAQAMAKIRDLTLLSDILPTGYHGCMAAGCRTGSTIYIAGAGPVGRCAAASARLLGASCIIVADRNKARLDLVRKAGYQTVDTSSETPVPDQIEAILGHREVDCGVDAVVSRPTVKAMPTAKSAPRPSSIRCSRWFGPAAPWGSRASTPTSTPARRRPRWRKRASSRWRSAKPGSSRRN